MSTQFVKPAMTFVNPSDYGNYEVAKVTIDRLFAEADLSDLDREILILRFGLGWRFHDIAAHVGQKYLGRTEENPLWEGAIRGRCKRSLAYLQAYVGYDPDDDAPDS
jgi:hypothetical protein